MPPSQATASVSGGMYSRRGYSLPTSVTAIPTRDRGRSAGMLNQGNSCYLSAVLQALLGQRCFVADLLRSARIMGSDTHAMEASARAKAALKADRMRRRDAGEEFTDSEGEDEEKEEDAAADPLVSATTALSRTFYHALVSLVLQMHETSHGILDTARLKAMIGARYSKFAGTQQQDAHEFLSECLAHLDDDILGVLKPAHASTSAHESEGSDEMDTSEGDGESSGHALLRRSLASSATLQLQIDTLSPIYKNLHCEIEQTLECVKCAYRRTKSEHFNDISLDLPDAVKPTRSASPAVSAAASPSPPAATLSLADSPEPLSSEPSSPSTPPSSSSSAAAPSPVLGEAPRPPMTRRKSSGHSSAAGSGLPPVPTPHCPKHGPSMVLALVQGVSTSHFRCSRPKCSEESAVAHPLPHSSQAASPTPLHSTTIPAANSASSSTGASSSSSSSASGARKGLGGSYLASLSELLAKFFQAHEIAYRCDRCDSDRSLKSYSFKQLPRVLILHVKRFQPNLLRGTYDKRADRLRIDDTIDVGFACTNNTRKPMPVEWEDEEATADDSEAAPRSATPRPSHQLDDHSTFAALFAATATAACKCGESGTCHHACGVLTESADIASFIQHQQQQPQSPPSTSPSPTTEPARPTRTSKRKAARSANGATVDEPDSSQSRKKARNNSSTPQCSDDSDSASYFSVESDAAAYMSGAISRLQAELRALQQQMVELSQSPLIAPAAALSFAPSALPARANRRESALSAMVMRISEVEAQIAQEKDKLRTLLQAKDGKCAKSLNNSSRCTPSPPPSSSPQSLGPGVVPLYELAAIIHHKGLIATSGHYITDLKSSGSTGVDAANHTGAVAWKRYDDSYVRTLEAHQAAQSAEREGYVFFFQYQPIINLLHAQHEHRHHQQQLQQALTARKTPQPDDSTSHATDSAAPPPTKRASPAPKRAPSPVVAAPPPPRPAPSSYVRPPAGLPAPFGPNAGRFKRWAMVQGQRVVWWVDKKGVVVLGTPPAAHEIDPKPPKQPKNNTN